MIDRHLIQYCRRTGKRPCPVCSSPIEIDGECPYCLEDAAWGPWVQVETSFGVQVRLRKRASGVVYLDVNDGPESIGVYIEADALLTALQTLLGDTTP